jgi:hypothetical protein
MAIHAIGQRRRRAAPTAPHPSGMTLTGSDALIDLPDPRARGHHLAGQLGDEPGGEVFAGQLDGLRHGGHRGAGEPGRVAGALAAQPFGELRLADLADCRRAG